MTSEQKKERRQLKHKLQSAVLKNHFHDSRFKAVATSRQLKMAAKQIADVILSGKNPQIPVLLGR